MEINASLTKALEEFKAQRALFYETYGEDSYVSLRKAYNEAERKVTLMTERLQTEDVLEEWRASVARLETLQKDWWACQDAWDDLDREAESLAKLFRHEYAWVIPRPVGGPRRQTEIGPPG